ncbi:dephospho-CoA kinase [Alteraurantiacibacter aestuarii]|uniref:Dephospho-CoA kinase n=1 Tax=Alteraurantiacibacter aestuarii TaxID=650004 RepID=A0A844ZNF5_9SPHN|nr:dephospho-CoA kinase [Alteraurantiacibacter aestuarii]MXO88596.1 dephospho-CoA kinase [Alteraurantiacibacter aestuarii]
MTGDAADGPLILGLTGSIGMGKSTVAGMFADLGVPVFDADAQVRRMQGAGGSLIARIEEVFPGSTGPEGVIREKLGAIVFNDPGALARLEAIVHPAVRAAREAFLARHRDAPLVVFDIPLLFEKGGSEDVDKILVVSAPADVQRARVLARPGMSEERLAAILALQMPDADKRARADYVIDTSVPLGETAKSVAALVEKLVH